MTVDVGADVIRRLALLLIFASLASCGISAGTPDNVLRLEGPYIPGSSGLGAAVFWLDEDRIIFLGHGGNRPATVEEKRRGVYGIYIWDISKKQVALYRAGATSLCVFNGQVRYQLSRKEGDWLPQKKRRLYVGRLESEVIVTTLEESSTFSPFSCGPIKQYVHMNGEKAYPFLPGDGFYRAENNLHPKQILSKAGEVIAEFPRRDLHVYQYLPWNKSYFFWEPIMSTERERSRTFIRYNPNESVTKQTISIPKVGGGSQAFLQTRKGIVMHVAGYPSSRDPGRSGLYRLNQKGEIAEVLRLGHIEINSHPVRGLSADGCRLAYSYAENIEKGSLSGGSKTYLEVMNLCK